MSLSSARIGAVKAHGSRTLVAACRVGQSSWTRSLVNCTTTTTTSSGRRAISNVSVGRFPATRLALAHNGAFARARAANFHTSSTRAASKERRPYLLADVGEGITECEVVKWHVTAGARVYEFDPLCEVQSDKASVEITSRFDGIVRDLSCDVGGIIKVGSPLCYIEMDAEDAAEAEDLDSGSNGVGAAAAEGGNSGIAAQQTCTPESSENLASQDTAQVSPESAVASPSAGKLSPATTAAAEDVSQPTHFEAMLGGFKGLQRSTNKEHLQSLATPAVRRVCKEHGVDVASVRGTGKDGRVTKEDVMQHIGLSSSGASAASSGAKAPFVEGAAPMIQDSQHYRGGDVPGEPSLAADNARTRVHGLAAGGSSSASPSQGAAAAVDTTPQPLTGIRKAMFRSLSASASIPIFTFAEEVDVTELEALRKQINADLAAAAAAKKQRSAATTTDSTSPATVGKLTLLPFLVKALSVAMLEHPLFQSQLQVPFLPPSSSPSAHFSEQASQARLVSRSTHDISIALSTPSGLLTPTIVDVQSHSVLSLAGKIADLQSKAGGGGSSLSATDMGPREGGTITLSNIGSIGGGLIGTTPVLPPTGQLAIGALGRIYDSPRYADTLPGYHQAPPRSSSAGGGGDELVRRKVLPATFAGDHRVLQGTELANLVLRWKQLCERPGGWLVSMR